ncbi:MAG: EamA family transporter [Acidimicrobiia bacterium]|nr:EamA family transporter [Acidimicrobiia bacterium]
MTEGVLWALLAALGFGFAQIFNRKSNQTLDAYRTAFGLLLGVEVVLVVRMIVSGELPLAMEMPWAAVALFTLATTLHFVGGWTLLALSQQRIGVARTGALVSAAPLVGTILAALVLDEPLTITILGGVVLAAVGVALISMSGGTKNGRNWSRPWLALTVATIWGTSPTIIRLGLERFDHPVLGVTVGLGISLVGNFVLLLLWQGRRTESIPASTYRWLLAGGVAGAIGVSSQWISFGLTTVAIAITVQQLAAVVVVALVPLMFHEPFERLNLTFLAGTAAMLVGSFIVVMSGA